MAISYSISYTFSPSTTISSSQVNTNFSDNSNTWNGIEAKTKTFSNLGVDTELKSGGTVSTANGTVAAPSLTFTNSTGSGIYRAGADNIVITTAGVSAIDISSAQLVTLTNNIVFNPTTKGIKGTTTNNNAAALNVGEYVESIASATNAPTSTQYGDLTSISLTAGDWDVTAGIFWTVNGATWSQYGHGISITSGNSPTGLNTGENFSNNTSTGSATVPASVTKFVSSYRMSLSGTTTVYLKYISNYTAGPPQAQGRLSARRVR